MHEAVSVNPFRCRMWAYHDRLEDHIDEDSCKAEIESFSKHGQFVPVLGRRLKGDPEYEFELIYGARRLFVARHINARLLVELRDVSDAEALVAMDVENRQRLDISPYERGLSYTRWLRAGLFSSQEDLARALAISPSVVSRLIKVARLPAAILGGFGDPRNVCETWALNLVDALDDPCRRQATLREAREIAAGSSRPPAQIVYSKLISASVKGRKVTRKPHDEVVQGADGAPLFRIRYQRDSIALLLPLEKVSETTLKKVRSAVVEALQEGGAQQAKSTKAPRNPLRRIEGALQAEVG